MLSGCLDEGVIHPTPLLGLGMAEHTVSARTGLWARRVKRDRDSGMADLALAARALLCMRLEMSFRHASSGSVLWCAGSWPGR